MLPTTPTRVLLPRDRQENEMMSETHAEEEREFPPPPPSTPGGWPVELAPPLVLDGGCCALAVRMRSSAGARPPRPSRCSTSRASGESPDKQTAGQHCIHDLAKGKKRPLNPRSISHRQAAQLICVLSACTLYSNTSIRPLECSLSDEKLRPSVPPARLPRLQSGSQVDFSVF